MAELGSEHGMPTDLTQDDLWWLEGDSPVEIADCDTNISKIGERLTKLVKGAFMINCVPEDIADATKKVAELCSNTEAAISALIVVVTRVLKTRNIRP